MDIRRANQQDAEQIEKIAKSLKIKEKPQENGFLIYVLDKKSYEERISSGYFYIAEEDGKVIGFLMCYDNKTLKEFIDSKKILKNCVTDFLLKQKTPFIWGDQIGIVPEFTRKGIGKELINRLFNDMKENKDDTFYTYVLHFPVKNKASIDFCSQIGLKRISEIKNSDKRVWGIYKKFLE